MTAASRAGDTTTARSTAASASSISASLASRALRATSSAAMRSRRRPPRGRCHQLEGQLAVGTVLVLLAGVCETKALLGATEGLARAGEVRIGRRLDRLLGRGSGGDQAKARIASVALCMRKRRARACRLSPFPRMPTNSGAPRCRPRSHRRAFDDAPRQPIHGRGAARSGGGVRSRHAPGPHGSPEPCSRWDAITSLRRAERR